MKLPLVLWYLRLSFQRKAFFLQKRFPKVIFRMPKRPWPEYRSYQLKLPKMTATQLITSPMSNINRVTGAVHLIGIVFAVVLTMTNMVYFRWTKKRLQILNLCINRRLLLSFCSFRNLFERLQCFQVYRETNGHQKFLQCHRSSRGSSLQLDHGECNTLCASRPCPLQPENINYGL